MKPSQRDLEEQTQAAHLHSIFEQAAQVEMLNQQLLVNPASALLLGLPQLGDLAQNPLAMLLAGAAQDPVPLPVPAAKITTRPFSICLVARRRI